MTGTATPKQELKNLRNISITQFRSTRCRSNLDQRLYVTVRGLR